MATKCKAYFFRIFKQPRRATWIWQKPIFFSPKTVNTAGIRHCRRFVFKWLIIFSWMYLHFFQIWKMKKLFLQKHDIFEHNRTVFVNIRLWCLILLFFLSMPEPLLMINVNLDLFTFQKSAANVKEVFMLFCFSSFLFKFRSSYYAN